MYYVICKGTILEALSSTKKSDHRSRQDCSFILRHICGFTVIYIRFTWGADVGEQKTLNPSIFSLTWTNYCRSPFTREQKDSRPLQLLQLLGISSKDRTIISFNWKYTRIVHTCTCTLTYNWHIYIELRESNIYLHLYTRIQVYYACTYICIG
jgi:hypothetical protein